ncbi:hypothetical protein CBR_g48269 [Chara braunii]|uniref:malate dehydrogenase n=1 Tax=Chara braunii TaxID=69332 RepID=A0A388M2M8_CHABU|nr:hypothetical protein CBR_g48269 [Chara braunii]|eukprot:GBG88739.1 hypothetical protein CBR_g48269 [Chara braunii]
MDEPIRVLVTGAAGQIGYALVPLIARGHLLGANQPVILHMLDIPPCADSLKGVEMELLDGAFPLLRGIVATTDVVEAATGVKVAVMVGGFPRKAGMERREVMGKNVTIYKEQAAALDKYADKSVKQRGAEIIKARKFSSALSAASAACNHVYNWLNGTPEGTWVSMGVYSDGSYGVPAGLIYSFPVTCKSGEWEIVQGLSIDDFSRGKMDATAAELLDEKNLADSIIKGT